MRTSRERMRGGGKDGVWIEGMLGGLLLYVRVVFRLLRRLVNLEGWMI